MHFESGESICLEQQGLITVGGQRRTRAHCWAEIEENSEIISDAAESMQHHRGTKLNHPSTSFGLEEGRLSRINFNPDLTTSILNVDFHLSHLLLQVHSDRGFIDFS
jgi:hypothetical protein